LAQDVNSALPHRPLTAFIKSAGVRFSNQGRSFGLRAVHSRTRGISRTKTCRQWPSTYRGWVDVPVRYHARPIFLPLLMCGRSPTSSRSVLRPGHAVRRRLPLYLGYFQILGERRHIPIFTPAGPPDFMIVDKPAGQVNLSRTRKRSCLNADPQSEFPAALLQQASPPSSTAPAPYLSTAST